MANVVLRKKNPRQSGGCFLEITVGFSLPTSLPPSRTQGNPRRERLLSNGSLSPPHHSSNFAGGCCL
jgi:hypothetical protein